MNQDTKTIENLYNSAIADNYDRDRFGLLADSYQTVIQQIKYSIPEPELKTILDLAVGTGKVLLELKKLFPQAKLSGIDLSEKMIAIAKTKMAIDLVRDDARNIEQYVTSNSMDLILIHFLLAYIAPETIIDKTAKILKPSGICSIATSTYQSFPKLQQLASQVLTSEELNVARVPQSPNELINILNHFGFNIIATDFVKKKVQFANFNEAYSWGINSGWFTQYLSNLSPEKIDFISSKKDLFPLEDEFQATIILARKT